MMKQCRFCGKELPDDASFCPYCARSLEEKEIVQVPVPKRRKILFLCVILAAVACAAGLFLYHTKPKTYDFGSAEVVYQHDGAVWHVLLRNMVGDVVHWKTPQDTFYRMCTAGTQGAVPLQLYVYDEKTGNSAAEEFLAELESSDLTAVPRGSVNRMECNEPVRDHPGFPLAALEADIVFDTDCGTNDLTWTLHLKNRDTIVLHQTVEIETNPEITYSYETTPLETSEELQALIEQIKTEVEDPNTVVTIILAPVVYEGDLLITDRSVCLSGTSDENGSTILRGCLSIDNREPLYATFRNIIFEGSGTGIYATEGFWATECSFIGKDAGIEGAEGSWPLLESCVFSNCGIGLHFNSTTATMKNAYYWGLEFTGNDTGVYLENVPGQDQLYFIECSFEGNGTDIRNDAGNEILFSLDG